MRTKAAIAVASLPRTGVAWGFQRLPAVRLGAGLICALLAAELVTLRTAAAQVELPAGANRDLVARECAACHDLDMVVGGAGATREVWKGTINEMLSYGARIDPEDQAKILDYLSSALGPGSRRPNAR
jgi:hypothetical protein